MFRYDNLFIAVPRIAILKRKKYSNLRKKKVPQIKHEVDLNKFKKPSKLKVKRLDQPRENEDVLIMRVLDFHIKKKRKSQRIRQ